MATFTKVNTFQLACYQKKHNIGSDQIVVALTSVAPVATNAVLADLTQISYTGLSSRNVTTTSLTQSSGTAKLVLADLVLSATATVASFRYVVLYNDTATNDELIGFYDYGSAIAMLTGDTFTIDFDAAAGAITGG